MTTAPKTPAATAGSSNAILDTAVEVVGVGLLAILAGANDDVGKLIVMFMVGLWCVFLVTNPSIVAKIASFPEAAAKNG
jgi:hypothetical protein